MTDLAGKKIAYYGYAGWIDSAGVTKVAAAFNAAINNNYDEVYLCMSSLGGYVGDGVFLYNHIRGLPIKVTIHNTGSIASIAVAVFVAGKERYCSAHGNFMIHPTTLGPFQEAMPWEKLDSSLKSALAEDERTENILREQTTLPDNMLSARRVRQVHIGPDEALTFGLVHGIKEFSLPQGNEIIQI